MERKGVKKPRVFDPSIIFDADLRDRIPENTTGFRGYSFFPTETSYMAPEQARGTSKRSGPAADIYSLGAILYELLVGHPPFRGETILDTLVKAVSQKPVSPRRLEAEIPTDLERICLKCLQKDPAQRYASAEALAEALRRFLAGGPVPDVPPSRAAPEQGPVRAGGLRKRLLWGAGVAVLLLAGLIVLFLGASRPGAPSAQDRQQLP